MLGIEYPIVQAGMVWCSGWELASAVSNAGGLGVLGAGSMYLESNLPKPRYVRFKMSQIPKEIQESFLKKIIVF